MILIPIFSHKRGQIKRNHIKPTIHPPSWWSAWTFSTFKGICTKYTENCVKRDWHWRKQTLLYLLLYFPCRFETKYESNIHRYQDTYLRAFTIVAILGRRLLSTYTTVIKDYDTTDILSEQTHNAKNMKGVPRYCQLHCLWSVGSGSHSGVIPSIVEQVAVQSWLTVRWYGIHWIKVKFNLLFQSYIKIWCIHL